MGCDIHLCIEKKVDGKWQAVKSKNKYFGRLSDEKPETLFGIYKNRNYSLFSILADVRNGYGFAGCNTGEGFVPISMPKGLPEDVSPEIKEESDGWGCDGHSHSWLTLKELLDYDWTQKTIRRGWVNGPQYFKWIQYNKKEGESPDEWCGGVGGGGVQHITEVEMEKLLEAINITNEDYRDQVSAVEKTLGYHYCEISWEQPYYKTCRWFLSDIIPQLLRMGSPEEVRLVFWFDN